MTGNDQTAAIESDRAIVRNGSSPAFREYRSSAGTGLL
jgi:hypothetical protein